MLQNQMGNKASEWKDDVVGRTREAVVIPGSKPGDVRDGSL